MENEKIRKLTTSGLMAALVFVLTCISIRLPSGVGYVHLGDSAVFLSGLVPGGLFGALAAAIGSALADAALGQPIWVPATLVIKFVMSLMVYFIVNHKKVFGVRTAIAVVAGSLVMLIGYFYAELIIFGSVEVSLLSSMFRGSFQSVSGILIFYLLLYALQKSKLLERFGKR